MVTYVAAQPNRAISDNGSYIEFIELALRDCNVFSCFKQYPEYREILEHVSPQLGSEYLELLVQENPDFLRNIDKFKINDLVGAPLLVDYPIIGSISPTTLRYIKVASDLQLLFGDLSGMTIAEVGVGYGGQLLVLDQIFHLGCYHLFDLPPVLEFVGKYLECHLLNGAYKKCTLNQAGGNKEYDLVISNYAFSELPSHLQRKYIKKILSKAKRGYLTMNSGLESSPFVGSFLALDELHDLLPSFEILEDKPSAAFMSVNTFILTWGANRLSL